MLMVTLLAFTPWQGPVIHSFIHSSFIQEGSIVTGAVELVSRGTVSVVSVFSHFTAGGGHRPDYKSDNLGHSVTSKERNK